MLKTFRDLLVWQKAHQLVLATYKATEIFPKIETFSLTSQMRRAAISVAANIVEGFRRRSLRDSLNFYNMADASLEELKYHILLSHDLGYIPTDAHDRFTDKTEEVGKLLFGWIESQKAHLQ